MSLQPAQKYAVLRHQHHFLQFHVVVVLEQALDIVARNLLKLTWRVLFVVLVVFGSHIVFLSACRLLPAALFSSLTLFAALTLLGLPPRSPVYVFSGHSADVLNLDADTNLVQLQQLVDVCEALATALSQQ